MQWASEGNAAALVGALAMTWPRRVEAEWLDELPADDPRAIRSRGDLRRVNRLMMQTGIMQRLMIRHCGPGEPRSLLELGSGDGTFMLRLAKRLAPRWPNLSVTLLDRQAIVSDRTREGFRALGWNAKIVTADVFDYLDDAESPRVDIVTANLFLHHFQGLRLARLLARTAELAPCFLACEPRRSALALGASRLLWAIGCNGVSRHDAAASVRAGFSGKELSALWPAGGAWDLHERQAGLFTHCFAARRGAPMPP